MRIAGPEGGVRIRDNDVDVVIGDNDPGGTTSPLAEPRVLLPNAEIREADTGCAPYEMSLRVGAPNGVSLVDNDLDLILRNDDS